MNKDADSIETELLIDSYGLSSALVRLAQLASPACRIEPQLLRHLRLACVPDADVSAEQQLWHSELVDSRGQTITFRNGVSRILRRRLRAWRQKEAALVARAKDVMTGLHASLPQLLILEDELAWAEVFDDDPVIRNGAEELLASILAGRDGLNHWLGRAWAGLPSSLKALPEGRQLAQVAAAEGASIPEEAGTPGGQVAHLLPLVALPIRLHGLRLDVNVPPSEATHVLDVPQTRPQALSVTWASGSEQLVFSSEVRGVNVSPGKVVMRTLAGAEYELEISSDLDTFEIEMLPAREGTSLVIRYGKGSSINQMIVDCGDRRTGDLLKKMLQGSIRHSPIELLVVTHSDNDRIAGALQLFQDGMPGFKVGNVWFNGMQHMRGLAP